MSENGTPAAAATHGAWTPEGEVPPPAPQRPSEDTIESLLKTVFDPEIPVDIYELGLIYAVEIADDGKVKVEMTLTTPSCPSAQELPAQVEEAVRMVMDGEITQGISCVLILKASRLLRDESGGS